MAVLSIVLIGSVAGWVSAPDGPEPIAFSATAIVQVQNTGNVAGVTLPPLSADLAAQFLRAGEVPTRVAARLGTEGDPAELGKSIGVNVDERAGTVRISSSSTDPEFAAVRANTFVEELIGFEIDRNIETLTAAIETRTARAEEVRSDVAAVDGEIAATSDTASLANLGEQRQDLEGRHSDLQGQIRTLEEYRDTSRITPAVTASPVRITSSGFEPPRSPFARAGLAGMLGLVIGGGLALFLHRTDLRIFNRREAEQAFGLQVVAEIPEATTAARSDFSVATVKDPRSDVSEAYRGLRSAISLMPLTRLGSENGKGTSHASLGDLPTPTSGRGRKNGRVVLVTSPGPAEGKTSTVANLAACWAEIGATVLVVSGDTRRPAIHKYLGVGDGPGLSNAVEHKVDRAELARLARKSVVPGVYVLTSGSRPLNPAVILEAEHELVKLCRELADVVIVDTPPVLVANDAMEMAVRADAVVILARAGHTRIESAARAAELIKRVGAPIVGSVLIGVAPMQGYSRYYQYYSDADGSEASSKRGRTQKRSSHSERRPAGSDRSGSRSGRESGSGRPTSPAAGAARAGAKSAQRRNN